MCSWFEVTRMYVYFCLLNHMQYRCFTISNKSTIKKNDLLPISCFLIFIELKQNRIANLKITKLSQIIYLAMVFNPIWVIQCHIDYRGPQIEKKNKLKLEICTDNFPIVGLHYLLYSMNNKTWKMGSQTHICFQYCSMNYLLQYIL